MLARLDTLPLPASGFRQAVEVLHDYSGKLVLPAGHEGPDLQTLIRMLTSRYALTVPLQTGYRTAAAAAEVLSFCSVHQSPAACSIVMKRLLEPTLLNATYVKGVLLPLIPTICQVLREHGIVDDLALAIQAIMVAWVDKVLGPEPDTDTTPYLSELERWARACSCHECRTARDFLQNPEQTTISLQQIGSTKRGHAEKQVWTYASRVATCFTIRTIPQGLRVCAICLLLAMQLLTVLPALDQQASFVFRRSEMAARQECGHINP